MLSAAEAARRIGALSGPGPADPDLAVAVKEHGLYKLVTVIGYHYVFEFGFEKRGFLGMGRGALRAGGITHDGRAFFIRSTSNQYVFSGFVGTQLFANIAVRPPAPGYEYVEVAIISAVDELVEAVDNGERGTLDAI